MTQRQTYHRHNTTTLLSDNVAERYRGHAYIRPWVPREKPAIPDEAYCIWEQIEDLGLRIVHPGTYVRAHCWRCRCRRCGSVRILTESKLAAARCNGYRHCINCKHAG